MPNGFNQNTQPESQHPQQASEAPEGNVSPGEQAQYELFVGQAYKLLYGGENLDLIENMGLQAKEAIDPNSGKNDPVYGLAQAVYMLVDRLITSAREQKKEFSPDVLMHGASEILESVADKFEVMGVLKDYTPKDLEKALYIMLDMYRDQAEKNGTLHTEDIQEDWQMLQQADQSGELEQMIAPLKKGAE